MKIYRLLTFLFVILCSVANAEDKKPKMILSVSDSAVFETIINNTDEEIFLDYNHTINTCSLWDNKNKLLIPQIKSDFSFYRKQKIISLYPNQYTGRRISFRMLIFHFGVRKPGKYTIQCTYFNSKQANNRFINNMKSNKVFIEITREAINKNINTLNYWMSK